MFVMSAQDPAANPDSTIQKNIQDRFNMDLNINWIERFQAKDVYATRFGPAISRMPSTMSRRARR